MTKWMLSLDESGTFDEKKPYFIIAGIIYDSDNFEKVRDYFVPLVNRICDIVEETELHARKFGTNKKKFSRTVLFSHIGVFKEVKPIVYIIDKEKTKMVKVYSKKSWKYNKILEFLYLDLIDNKLIESNDELSILIDNIELTEEEEKNLYEWLPKKYKNIKFVMKGDSKDFKFIQMADMIANAFSKSEKCDLDNYDMKILDPFIEVFPKKYKNNYIKDCRCDDELQIK